MKYLFLIIRHIFPRKRWTQIKEIPVHDYNDNGTLTEYPIYRKILLRDQFGNLKSFKV